ncbi:MAG: phosphate ABC transporter substrate-binding protein PstS [Candidatus Binataceae bacterium]|jgi:phosphate transport system substrate-binding protein
MISRRTLGQVLIGLLFLLSARTASAQLLINGAGATFPYPLYSKWFDAYAAAHPMVHFNYQSIGSGGGIKQLENRTVDFGASDAPMNDEQLKSAPDKILHFPTVLGADVVTYNLPGLTQPLKLTGLLVADIYLGKVTKWNDPAIAELNPGVALPDSDIVVCHRSDGSGTTYIFTDYLSKASPAWNKGVGKGTAVRWPVGLGGKGNEGVTALVRQTPGAIGYVELIYAANNKLPAATLRNRDGKWVEASLKTVSAAAAAVEMPADFRVSITAAPGPDSYPIASFTYLLIYANQKDAAKGKAIVDFITWMLHKGQEYAPALSYAPLPAAVVDAEEKQLKAVVLPNS